MPIKLFTSPVMVKNFGRSDVSMQQVKQNYVLVVTYDYLGLSCHRTISRRSRSCAKFCRCVQQVRLSLFAAGFYCNFRAPFESSCLCFLCVFLTYFVQHFSLAQSNFCKSLRRSYRLRTVSPLNSIDPQLNFIGIKRLQSLITSPAFLLFKEAPHFLFFSCIQTVLSLVYFLFCLRASF